MILSSLQEIEPFVRTGDIFAFGSNRWLSQCIEAFTDSNQSHVGTAVVLQDKGPHLLAEATRQGMVLSFLENTCKHFTDIWYLPLARGADFNTAEFLEMTLDVCQRNVPYDYAAIRAYFFGKEPPASLDRLYCSEYCALGLKVGGLYTGTTSVTPIQVCRLNVYDNDYYQIKWEESEGPKEIVGWNTIDPCLSDLRCTWWQYRGDEGHPLAVSVPKEWRRR